MALSSTDRLHEKQGRSTCRVRLEGPGGSISAYLKRHYRVSWREELAAALDFNGRHTPAGAEWRHLAAARRLGLRVPEPVAAGERLGPHGRLQSYLLVRELSGQLALNELLPHARAAMTPAAFAAWKRRVIAEMAAMVARLHRARLFHNDLYLCHFFVDARDPAHPGDEPTLIDLHRLARHRTLAAWHRWKDLGQLLFSTEGVLGIARRDRLRFWVAYRRAMGWNSDGLERRAVALRARRYLARHRPRVRRE
jgi:heptose I phosphotransferase